MGRRTIFIWAGLAAALSVIAVAIVAIAFLTHPSDTTTLRADAAPGTAGPATTAPVARSTPATPPAAAGPPTATPAATAALPPPAGAGTPATLPLPASTPGTTTALATASPAGAPPTGASFFRAFLEQEAAKTGDPDLKFKGSTTWSLVDGGADGQMVESRVTIPDRQWFVSVRLKKNNDATLPATHMVEISITGPPGQPPPVGKVLAFRFKTSEEASPEQVTNVSQKVIDGLYWVALSDDPKNAKLPSLFRLPWIDILLEYPTGKRAVLSLEKGDEGKRVMEAALSAWSSPPTR